RLPDPAEAERLQRLLLLAARAIGRANLPELEGGGHQAGASPAASGSGLWALGSGLLVSRPSTSATLMPRSSATSSGFRRDSSAFTVAFTRLIGFWEPSDFDRTSWIPA